MERLIKLNTNENPYGPSPLALDAMHRECNDSLRLYPDPEATALKRAIADLHATSGVTEHHVFIGNGSDEVLAHVFRALLKKPAPLFCPDISYSFYPTYARLYEVDTRIIPLCRDLTIDVADYLHENEKCGGILLANPNAPTGVMLPLEAIGRLAQGRPEAVVVIDEAYIDFGGESAIGLIQRFPNLLVTQTLSKSYALAGLRVGFAVGHPDLITGLERVKNSFNSYPVDRIALAGAVAALRDQAYFQHITANVIATRERLSGALRQHGYDVLPSSANFIFVRHPQRDAASTAARLREKGIVVRHFAAPRIDEFLRISIGTDLECDTLLQALAEIPLPLPRERT